MKRSVWNEKINWKCEWRLSAKLKSMKFPVCSLPSHKNQWEINLRRMSNKDSFSFHRGALEWKVELRTALKWVHFEENVRQCRITNYWWKKIIFFRIKEGKTIMDGVQHMIRSEIMLVKTLGQTFKKRNTYSLRAILFAVLKNSPLVLAIIISDRVTNSSENAI